MVEHLHHDIEESGWGSLWLSAFALLVRQAEEAQVPEDPVEDRLLFDG